METKETVESTHASLPTEPIFFSPSEITQLATSLVVSSGYLFGPTISQTQSHSSETSKRFYDFLLNSNTVTRTKVLNQFVIELASEHLKVNGQVKNFWGLSFIDLMAIYKNSTSSKSTHVSRQETFRLYDFESINKMDLLTNHQLVQKSYHTIRVEDTNERLNPYMLVMYVGGRLLLLNLAPVEKGNVLSAYRSRQLESHGPLNADFDGDQIPEKNTNEFVTHNMENYGQKLFYFDPGCDGFTITWTFDGFELGVKDDLPPPLLSDSDEEDNGKTAEQN